MIIIFLNITRYITQCLLSSMSWVDLTSCGCDSKIVRYYCMPRKVLNILTNVQGRMTLQSLTRNILVRLCHPLRGRRPKPWLTREWDFYFRLHVWGQSLISCLWVLSVDHVWHESENASRQVNLEINLRQQGLTQFRCRCGTKGGGSVQWGGVPQKRKTYRHFLSFHVCSTIGKPSLKKAAVNKFTNFIPKNFIEFNMHIQSLLDAFLNQCTSLHNGTRGIFKGNRLSTTSNILEVK